jgi:hypothetical protein
MKGAFTDASIPQEKRLNKRLNNGLATVRMKHSCAFAGPVSLE